MTHICAFVYCQNAIITRLTNWKFLCCFDCFVVGGTFASVPLGSICRSKVTGSKDKYLCNFAGYYQISIQILYSNLLCMSASFHCYVNRVCCQFFFNICKLIVEKWYLSVVLIHFFFFYCEWDWMRVILSSSSIVKAQLYFICSELYYQHIRTFEHR